MAAEKQEAERMAAEKQEAERMAAEKEEAERMAAEKQEAERTAAEKEEAERMAAESKGKVPSEAKADAERRLRNAVESSDWRPAPNVKMDRFAEFLANSGERSSSSKSGSVGNPSLIVVFDFDHTLAAEHMYYELRSERGLARQRYEPEGFYEWIFGGETRLDLLCDCLLALHTAGATLHVLSNGVEEEIEVALDTVGVRELFTSVMGAKAQQRCGTGGLGKPGMLARLALSEAMPASPAPSSGSVILFLDDDLDNFPEVGPGSGSLDPQIGSSWTLEREAGVAGASTVAGSPEPANARLVAWPVVPARGLSKAALTKLSKLLEKA